MQGSGQNKVSKAHSQAREGLARSHKLQKGHDILRDHEISTLLGSSVEITASSAGPFETMSGVDHTVEPGIINLGDFRDDRKLHERSLGETCRCWD